MGLGKTFSGRKRDIHLVVVQENCNGSFDSAFVGYLGQLTEKVGCLIEAQYHLFL